MKNDIPCNLPCKSLYHALLHLDSIRLYSLNRIFVILLTTMFQRVIGNAGFRMRINLLLRGFLAGRAGILFPLDESYVPPREIIYCWYVGIVVLYLNPFLSVRLNGFEFSIQSYRWCTVHFTRVFLSSDLYSLSLARSTSLRASPKFSLSNLESHLKQLLFAQL